MTIAAGILCSDGIIVCADTEHSDGVGKFQQSKINALGDHTFITGAGSSDYIQMTVDKISDSFLLSRPANESKAREIIESVIRKVHAEHIFNFYDASDPNRPMMSLIIATRCIDGKLALIKTVDSATRLGSSFEVTGIGQFIFDYWCRYFYRENLNMKVTSYLAMFMMKEVKKAHPGCGGQSQICHLPKEVGGPRVTNVYDESRLLNNFPDSIVRILSVCMDMSVPDEWIKTKLEEFAQGIRDMRSAERQAQTDREQFLKLTKEHRAS